MLLFVQKRAWGFGSTSSVFGFRVSVLEFRFSVFGLRVDGYPGGRTAQERMCPLGLVSFRRRVQGLMASNYSKQTLNTTLYGALFGVEGLGFRVQGLRVEDLGLRV